MQFNSTYLGQKVVVNFADALDPLDDLEEVKIYYCETGEEIDYNKIPNDEWRRLHAEVKSAFSSWQAENTIGWD